MSSPGPLPSEFGRYQVLEELGSGAMGIVYLCVDPRLSRPVAIKVMRESEFMTPAEREQFHSRFRHEAEAAGRLTHPGIVQIYDVGPSWIVMEFLEGQPLGAVLKRGDRLSVRRAVHLVSQVADAVDYAHRHGIVHRDIKPANIMLLSEGGGVKVMDFGVARLEHSTLTALGTVVGSVRYMSPEQMMGERVDGRADVFSLGAVAYELLTGQAPFPGKTITEVVSRVVHGAHVPPRKADQRLPETLDAVFARVFATRPTDRYALASEFARDLAQAAEPALDLEVAAGADGLPSVRTETPAPTAGPGATLPARAAAGPEILETIVLDDLPGRLFVAVVPAGSRVAIDGSEVRVPEEGLGLSLGRHSLEVRAEGFEAVSCRIELTAAHPVLHFSTALEHPAGESLRDFLALGADVTPPLRATGDLPRTPQGASPGTALVDVYVGQAGEVARVTVVAGEATLAHALRDAVKGWTFRPARRNGEAVAARLRVQHTFGPAA